MFAKAFDRDAFVDLRGDEAEDDWRMGRVGFRVDVTRGPDEGFAEGAVFTGVAEIFLTTPVALPGETA